MNGLEEMKRRKVLHVTESMGGGTATALVEFVRSSPEYEHSIVYMNRAGSQVSVDIAALFAHSYESIEGLVGLRKSMRRAIDELNPDIVHLHSSWAGLIGRLGRVRSFRSFAIAYSPHCFYFERRDVGAARRLAARIIERMLAKRADVVICVSPHEVTLAQSLGARPYLVPNTTRIRKAEIPRARVRSKAPSIVTVGRACQQKDPDFFVQVVTLTRASRPDLQWTWIGAGDEAKESLLRASGVDVTGWLEQSEILERLVSADVYVHTAAWESCPMSILEAAAVELPIVARSIPSLVSLGLPSGLGAPNDVAREILAVLGRSENESIVDVPQVEVARNHANDVQIAALAIAYARARQTSSETQGAGVP